MSLEERELLDLEKAVKLLEQATITEKMTQMVGKPIDYLMSKLPKGAEAQIYSLVEKALHKAADAALWSLNNEPNREASTKTNKFFAAVSGAVGGTFGFSALAIELPLSTTIMLRSVADIARSEGFDLDKVETKQACLEVFALGGPSENDNAVDTAYENDDAVDTAYENDDAVDTAYYATRSFTAEAMQILSKELSEIATKKVSVNAAMNLTPTQTGKWLATLIEKVATRFGIVITEKTAAQVVPVIGAFAGATLNIMFTDYYQDMARGHFIIKRLEKKYGSELIKSEYMKILNLVRS
ncbi:TPA: EcsC family protein [Escherichia coli]|uniref:EcsC family protein n=1 Tax=Escherichia coli TaxID=562 RepID=UPI0010CADC47|nr:EcsC family protein [Escherichia coli]EHT2172744.1 EcsC family protein [Escherichia coli O168]EFD5023668.1 EcsC family protein [Escherichia coli]EFD5038014.1 EcsC family protein [Escherichia coli]EFE6091646.1 EcsC family protein [Escherichia coli]EFH4238532.1 EcsC family protein [Escherichia coli]